MNPLLLSSLIAASLGFGAAWTWQGYRTDAYKLEVTNDKLAVEQAARRAVADSNAKVADAQAAAQAATDRVHRDVAGAVASGNRLRDTLATAVRAASTDLQTCTGQVATIGELLNSSTELSRRIAEEADQWVAQAIALQQSWPTNK